MTTRRHAAAPNEEWVLMYRGGLTRPRIAALTNAPAKTIGYHLAVALAADPGLQTAHEQAASQAPRQVSVQGLSRMRQLVAMVQETGHYPTRSAEDTDERSLASWLDRRRNEDAAGTLAPAYRDGLAALPDWQRPGRSVAGDARWQARLTALVRCRAQGHDWPRHKAVESDLEHDLGIWLHAQRQKARRGELEPDKLCALDEALPGWRSGRRRGRRLRNSSSRAGN